MVTTLSLLVTLVFPVQFERQWITLGWALEGAALCWLFRRVPHDGLRLTGALQSKNAGSVFGCLGFIIGFVIFVPFLVIDLVVAAGLMSVGMMMLPPVMVSLPFKVLLFVLVDGWYLIVGSLVKGYTG